MEGRGPLLGLGYERPVVRQDREQTLLSEHPNGLAGGRLTGVVLVSEHGHGRYAFARLPLSGLDTGAQFAGYSIRRVLDGHQMIMPYPV